MTVSPQILVVASAIASAVVAALLLKLSGVTSYPIRSTVTGLATMGTMIIVIQWLKARGKL